MEMHKYIIEREIPKVGTFEHQQLRDASKASNAVLAELGPASADRPRRRSAIEIAYDTLLFERACGERLLAGAWDWSRSPSNDQGYAALGEFGERGLGVIAYSRAVKFGTLGVCPQR